MTTTDDSIHFLSLPEEVTHLICCYLPPKDALSLACTCTQLSQETVSILRPMPVLVDDKRYTNVAGSDATLLVSVPIYFPESLHSVLVTGWWSPILYFKVPVYMILTEQSNEYKKAIPPGADESANIVWQYLLECDKAAPWEMSFKPKSGHTYYIWCSLSEAGNPTIRYRFQIKEVTVASIAWRSKAKTDIFQKFADLGWIPNCLGKPWGPEAILYETGVFLEDNSARSEGDFLSFSMWDQLLPFGSSWTPDIQRAWREYMIWKSAFISDSPLSAGGLPRPYDGPNNGDTKDWNQMKLRNVLLSWPKGDSARTLSLLRQRLTTLISSSFNTIVPIPLMYMVQGVSLGDNRSSGHNFVILELRNGCLDDARVVSPFRNGIFGFCFTPITGSAYLLLTTTDSETCESGMWVLLNDNTNYNLISSILLEHADTAALIVLSNVCQALQSVPHEDRPATPMGKWWLSKRLPLDDESMMVAEELLANLQVAHDVFGEEDSSDDEEYDDEEYYDNEFNDWEYQDDDGWEYAWLTYDGRNEY